MVGLNNIEMIPITYREWIMGNIHTKTLKLIRYENSICNF